MKKTNSIIIFIFIAILLGGFYLLSCKPETGDECSTNADCEEDQYCKKDKGDCDADGECTDKVETCIEVVAPVCGCDDVNYNSECYAALANVSVKADGECVEDTNNDGGPSCASNSDCDETQYCKRDIGACDTDGVCTLITEVCTLDVQNDPVCGCDGSTYSNLCNAAYSGVSVASTGECAE